MKILIVSGRSGSGKSSALNIVEDLGYYCIDNLPLSLLPDIVAKLKGEHQNITHLALGVDVRTPQSDLLAFESVLAQLSTFGTVDVLYLNARDDVLVSRYGASRRKHPLADRYASLSEAILAESSLLAPIVMVSTLQVDTSTLSIHQLQHILSLKLGDHSQMVVVLESFGYKRGLPLDADIVFDVRHLPNPFWELSLREFTGLHPEVNAYLSGFDEVNTMFDDLYQIIAKWIPIYRATHRHSLTIAIGCTGGKHRSVYLVERLATVLRTHHYSSIEIVHREAKHWS